MEICAAVWALLLQESSTLLSNRASWILFEHRARAFGQKYDTLTYVMCTVTLYAVCLSVTYQLLTRKRKDVEKATLA